MACSCKLRSASSLLLTVSLLITHVASQNSVKIAVYWGQNGNEGTLAETCSTGLYAFVSIAFLSVFGSGQTPTLNLASHCDPTLLGGCSALSADVVSCQSKGVKVLLSIGGSAGNYSLASTDDAQSMATYLWDNFLGGTSPSRPLGHAVLDGIDFDIVTGLMKHYDDLARNLTSLCKGAKGGKKYMLTAAPRCPYPNVPLGAALGAGLFDHVWVLFYNQARCQYAHGDASMLQSAWRTWTRALPSASVFLGLLASPDVPDGGFIDADVLALQVLPVVKRAVNFGGIMLWSRYYDKTYGYSQKLQGDAPIGSPIPGPSPTKRIVICKKSLSLSWPLVSSTIVLPPSQRLKCFVNVCNMIIVRMISGIWPNDQIPTPHLDRALLGGAQPVWLVGPCRKRHNK